MKKLLLPLICSLVFISCGNSNLARQYYTEALAHYKKHDFTETVKSLDQSLKIKPRDRDSLFLKAKSSFLTKDFETSIPILEKLCKSDKSNFDYKFWLLRNYIFSEKYSSAEELLKAMLKSNTEDWRLYYWAAQLALKKENFEEYFACLNSAEEILNSTSQVYQELALIWNEFGLSDRYHKYYLKMEAVKK